jgi:hypothetical protein
MKQFKVKKLQTQIIDPEKLEDPYELESAEIGEGELNWDEIEIFDCSEEDDRGHLPT